MGKVVCGFFEEGLADVSFVIIKGRRVNYISLISRFRARVLTLVFNHYSVLPSTEGLDPHATSEIMTCNPMVTRDL